MSTGMYLEGVLLLSCERTAETLISKPAASAAHLAVWNVVFIVWTRTSNCPHGTFLAIPGRSTQGTTLTRPLGNIGRTVKLRCRLLSRQSGHLARRADTRDLAGGRNEREASLSWA